MINYNDMYYIYNNNMPVYSTTSTISWNEPGAGSAWSFYEPAKVVIYVPCSVTSVKKGKGAKLK